MLKSTLGKMVIGAVVGSAIGYGIFSAAIGPVTQTINGNISAEKETVSVVSVANENAPTVSTTTQTVTRLSPKAEQIILFNTPVVYETVQATLERLELLKAKGYKEAYLVLDSPGGSVFDGAKLIGWMKYSPLKVHTVCDGLCASMAAHLFEVGNIRYMTDKSTLMFHPASGGVRGTLEEMNSQLNYVMTYVNRLDESVAKRAGTSYNDFKAKTLVEYWIETQDALNTGFADKLTFITYDRSASEVLNMERHVHQLGKIIPARLLEPGVLELESIRLPIKVDVQGKLIK